MFSFDNHYAIDNLNYFKSPSIISKILKMLKFNFKVKLTPTTIRNMPRMWKARARISYYLQTKRRKYSI